MRLTRLVAGLALLFFASAQYWGLRIAPPDKTMGDVYRILFVHVPAAWNALFFLVLSFFSCLLYLFRKNLLWDRLAESSAELGTVLTGITLALGSLWARPTWGVWWTWDPRLTTTALLLILYLGYLILRRLVEDPIRRARVAASLGILIFLNVPVVYFSVKWWRTLHQVQSSPETMAPEMVIPLRLNALALLGLSLLFLAWRMRIAARKTRLEEREALPPKSTGVRA